MAVGHRLPGGQPLHGAHLAPPPEGGAETEVRPHAGRGSIPYISATLAAEAGLVMGYLSGRARPVRHTGSSAPTRTRGCCSSARTWQAVDKLDVDAEAFVRWVARTRSLRAASSRACRGCASTWRAMLKGYLATLEGEDRSGRRAELPRCPTPGAGRGGPQGRYRLSSSAPDQRAMIDRSVAMAVIEGYAEHVMDGVGTGGLPSLPRLRAAMDKRRATASPIAKLLQRLLGLDMKLRQYQQGKRFCDAVVGGRGTRRAQPRGDRPDAMPSLAEIDDPEGWRKRTGFWRPLHYVVGSGEHAL